MSFPGKGALEADVAAALRDESSVMSANDSDAPEGVAVNGFRIEAAGDAPAHGTDGSLIHRFTVRQATGEPIACRVVFPAFFIELVHAHAKREALDEADRLWGWPGEEALANYSAS